jgi:hypothetical protein
MDSAPEQVDIVTSTVEESHSTSEEAGIPFHPTTQIEDILFPWALVPVRFELYGSTNSVDDIKVVDIARQLVKEQFPGLSPHAVPRFVQGCDLVIHETSIYHLTGGKISADFFYARDSHGMDSIAHSIRHETSFDEPSSFGFKYTGYKPIRSVNRMKNDTVLTVATSLDDWENPLVLVVFTVNYRILSVFDQMALARLRETNRADLPYRSPPCPNNSPTRS